MSAGKLPSRGAPGPCPILMPPEIPLTDTSPRSPPLDRGSMVIRVTVSLPPVVSCDQYAPGCPDWSVRVSVPLYRREVRSPERFDTQALTTPLERVKLVL